MFDRDELGNYRVSSIVFLVLIIISFTFVLFSTRASDDICVFETQGYDLMEEFGKWVPHEIGRDGIWINGINIPLRDDGYPRVVPFKKSTDIYTVKTILYDTNNYVEDGTYSLSFKGTGKIKLGFDAENSTFDKAGSYNVLVIGTGKGIYIEILESDILDPIHDIHIYSPTKKELRTCEIQKTDTIKTNNNESKYIVVSESGLIESIDNLEISESFDWKDKIITGLITLFAILAIIYILK